MKLLKPIVERATFITGIVLLSACLEPQPAPSLHEIDSSNFTVDVLHKGLSHPWAIAELPDGNFLVTEKGGKLLRLSGETQSEIKGLPEGIFTQGQGGLLDVMLSPDYKKTMKVYLSYAYGTMEENGTALAVGTLKGNRLTNVETLFKASPPKFAPQHYGGRIAVLPDGSIILTLGDGFALREDAQKPDTHLGKIVRLNPLGQAPKDNPFINQSEYKAEIYSFGHRNVQGLTYDSETNTLWAHEHGPRGGDELNIIQAGENYGWPIATKGVDYNGARISPYEKYKDMKEPEYYWTPSIAPSGLEIYRGRLFPKWNGDALLGGLASKDLRRLDIEKGRVVSEEDLLSDLGLRIRDVFIASDGAVLLLTDDTKDKDENKISGQLIRLSPK